MILIPTKVIGRIVLLTIAGFSPFCFGQGTYTPLDPGRIYGTPEPIGPSSRRGGLIISEIMYNPTNRADARELEYIEIYNTNPWFENIGGYRLSGEVDYVFPPNTTIPAQSYLLVAPVPADIQAVYGVAAMGGFTNRLSNGGGTIRLRDRADSVLIEAIYSDAGGAASLPVAADGAGHSLVLARPSYGERDARAWAASDRMGGSPRAAETTAANPYRTIVINEFLAHTDEPAVDFIELFNYSAASVNIDGCILTDDAATNKFVIPAGTTIPARGFVSFNQTQLGFALSSGGETIYLKNPSNTKVIDAVRFEAQANGVATGRYPDGAPSFHELTSPTPGAINSPLLLRPVVINEIHYNPLSGDNADEFIELHNRGASPVNIGGWRLADGITYTFPSNTTIAANSYVVVANDRLRLLANHSGLSAALVLGNYGGSLGNGGERVALTMPDQVIATNDFGLLETNTIRIVVDEVTYGTGGRWGRFHDGNGASLELVDARSDNRLAANWADSDDSNDSGWTTVEVTGILDHGGMSSADQLQLFLLGEGECLVDNVEVIPQGGGNVLPNATFDSGMSGWVVQGTHEDSAWQASGGFGGGGCLRVVATGRGDPGGNRIRAPLSSVIANGSGATLRARVRWLKGHPELLLRLHGNWLEASGNILTSSATGTPGARNSRAQNNVGPAIDDVTHSPILPAANQPVTISARVHDPDGITSLFVHYRVDPSSTFTPVAMVYNGAGYYSATIPGQLANTRVAFYIEARDNFFSPVNSRFPSDAPTRECLIGFGESVPSGSFGTYRFWLTQNTINRWNSRGKNSNRGLDATFVHGNTRVMYNIQTLYSGSPWLTPGYSGPLGGVCGYVLRFTDDDLFLGEDDFVLDWPIRDGSKQAEQAAYWIGKEIGAVHNYRRFIRLYINNNRRSDVYEDVQQPGSAMIEQFFPDDDEGTLHKIEDWFEFDDTGDTKLGNVDATLQNFVTTGGKKTARYRWNWRPRAAQESANDFTNLFALVDAVNTSGGYEPYTTRVENLIDLERWMGALAYERIAGNWDSYGYNRGKNMYAYKPQDSGWVLMPWDIDFVFNYGADGPTTSLFGGNEPLVNAMKNHPPFQRIFWRKLEEAVNGPMVSANITPMLTAKYNALVANGISPEAITGITSYIDQRRNYILSQLATVAANFTVSGPTTFSTNRNLITISGTAPVGVKTITVNGVAYRPVWTSVTAWTLRIALNAGANNLVIRGLNGQGVAVPGGTINLSITYTGANELPQDKLVINEIMYNHLLPDAEFVEVHNTSTVNAFDVSRWRITGIDADIPDGTIIEPGAFLVFAKDRDVFASIFSSSINVAGVYDGTLDNGGETLRLIRPGATPAQDTIIDQVTFDDDAPWPSAADGMGPSLQLVDPLQDNNRVANWGVSFDPGQTNPPRIFIPITASWRYNQTDNLDGVNWTARNYNDAAWPSGGAVLAVENAALPVAINTQLAPATPPLRTTYYFRSYFNFTGSVANVSLVFSNLLDDGAVFYLNGVELGRVGMNPGAVSYATFANRTVADATTYEVLVFNPTNLVQGSNSIAVEVHQVNATSSDIVFGASVSTAAAGSSSMYTPGRANSVQGTVAAFPTLWLNEVLPNNTVGLTDRFGDRDPWVEIYNGGSSVINLSGYYLANQYSNLLQWPFPATASIAPGQFLIVWLDNEPGESITTELHANFRINSTTGSVVLARSGPTRIIDHINYNVASAGRSHGGYPDGSVSGRRTFSIITPGATNNPAGALINVFINEWMADNTTTLADPHDGDYEDWIELYNADSDPVDLSGYFLTDTLTNTAKWAFPEGTVIPGRSNLLVWADEETGQNDPGFERHTNFKLAKGGTAIALYGEGGVLIDAVTSGPQTNGVTQGRFGDGQASIFYMTPTPRLPNFMAGSGNSPPTIALITDKVVNESSLLSFTVSASDPDVGQSLVFSLEAGAPAGAIINASSGAFGWSPTEAQGPGSYTITVRVIDNGSPALSATRSFNVQVGEVNNPPVLAGIPDRTVSEGSLLSVTATATDPDTPVQTLTYALDATPPAGVSINPSSGALTWTPTEVQGHGTHFITVRVTDNGEPVLTNTTTFTVIVNEVNAAPVLAPIASQTNSVGATFSFTASATDPDLPAQTLTYALEPGFPAGASIDSRTGAFSWTPTAGQASTTNVLAVRVADDGAPTLSHTRPFTIVVNAASVLRVRSINVSSSGVVTLTWDSVPGKTYRLQQARDLNDAWTDIGTPVTATGTSTTATDNVGANARRFYRVQQTN